MNSTFLKPVDLKLARAEAQVLELCEKMDEWCSKNQIECKCELHEGRLGFKIIVTSFENTAFLEEWGILVGELMHNLRSCLDNLAYALARLRQDPPSSPHQISFPICQLEADFKKKPLPKLLQQLPVVAVDLIEKIQPFQRLDPTVEGQPNTDPLVLLQWFNNVDKHQVPTVLLMVPTGDIKSSFQIEFYSEEDAALNGPPQTEFFGYALKHGSILMDFKTTRPLEKISGNFSFSAKVRIDCFNGNEPAHLIFKQLHYYTATIVHQFRGFFD
jgi:hypothetical protein